MTAITSAAPALELRGVTKRYGDRTVLDDVDLRLDPGATVALLGPNGAGKSTLVSIAAGLLAPDTGTATVGGRSARAGTTGGGHQVGLAPQDVGIYPPLTVRQNLTCFGEVAGLRAGEARARAAELAPMLRLDHLMDRPAGQLSGGEQRRLHTAIALVHRPALVLLDEPTAGADIPTRAAILDVVHQLASDGAAVIYTTHYLPEVETLDADVAVLEGGRIIATDTVQGLIAAHARSVLLLDFDADPPDLGPEATVSGRRVTLACADAATTLTDTLARLGSASGTLAGVEIVRPSLEAAYLQLTGRRDASSGPPADASGTPTPAGDLAATVSATSAGTGTVAPEGPS